MTAALFRHRVLPQQARDVRHDLRSISNATAGAKALALGATGPAVEALQRALRGVGAYAGPLSGTFDAATEAAVKQLQAGAKLPQTGIADRKELAALETRQLFVKSGFERPARMGEKGRDILEVERKLSALGYSTGKVDGAFDAQTLKALAKYRKADASVEDSGKRIGAGVLDGLRDTVRTVETALQQLGAKVGKPDAWYGEKTRNAVERFQKKHGLKVTGDANAQTRRALVNEAVRREGRFPDVSSKNFQRGYDTSHYQSEATFDRLMRDPKTKFMAIKATEGTGYTDPTFKHRWAEMGRKLEPGKFDLRMAYHFLTPGNGRAQANHFLHVLGIHGKLKPGTRLALDWEASALSSPGTLREAAKRIHEVTGSWPLIYTSASRVAQAHSVVPHAPIWDAHWSPTKADYKNPFVQVAGSPIDRDVFTGSELALRKWAGWV
jgi:peptidoglycan hydrolase-like protein with peptidoglycan-binding domain/GH25 family lysozyme M1 (1,4-beta-N-acetylmuramidase)